MFYQTHSSTVQQHALHYVPLKKVNLESKAIFSTVLFIKHLSHNVYNFTMFIFHMQCTQIHSFMCSMCKKLTYLSINGRICNHVHTAPFTQHSIGLSSGDLPTILFSRNLTPVLLNIYCIRSDGVTTYFSSD